MAGSGNSIVVLNTRERLVSTDHNDIQSMIGADIASTLARLLLSKPAFGVDYGGSIETISETTDSPLTAAVIDGLRPFPVDGTASMLIKPGALVVADPDGTPAPYDVPHKWVVDPGVATVGQLVLAAGGGSPRVDVIECARTVETFVTDNRDIFNPSTGLFSPVNVDKARRGRLQYRVRAGTPGGGFPGTASGWLPLAIAAVPSAAATWDDCQLWDVRPLVADRADAPFRVARTFPSYADAGRRQNVWTDLQTAGQVRIYGQAEGALGEYRAGGRLGQFASAGGANPVAFFDLRSSANQERSFPGFVANAPWYVYLIFPYGLPRWVRYTPAGSGGRVPLGCRGIPTVSVTRCFSDGTPGGSGVKTPSATGLADPPTANAVAILAGRADAGALPLGVNGDGDALTLVNPNLFQIAPSATSSDDWAQWTLTDNSTHPGNARALYLRLSADFDLSADVNIFIDGRVTISSTGDGLTSQMATASVDGPMMELASRNATPAIKSAAICVKVPLALDFTGAWQANRTFKVRWTYDVQPNGFANAVQNQQLEVVGWELGS